MWYNSKKKEEKSMPAVAYLEDLKKIERESKAFREEFPEAYKRLTSIIKGNRKVGYKNICKLLLEEATPEKLKGEEG